MGAPASSPVDAPAQILAEAARAAASVPTPKHGLDATGVRELLAGFELEKGDALADAARHRVRADRAEVREQEARSFAEKMRRQSIWLPITVGGGSFLLGFGLGTLVR